MQNSELDFESIQHITADAIGQPGQRVFYLQAWPGTDGSQVSFIIEKIQLQSLALGIEQMVTELTRQKPELVLPTVDFEPDRMHIQPPVDPQFRAGAIGIGYDVDRDCIVIQVSEFTTEEDSPQEGKTYRFWCTRQQARNLAAWAEQVIERGRPICTQCGQPMEPEGHFCPKKNGNKKK